jgi:twitching motility two-component system response regulator PilG
MNESNLSRLKVMVIDDSNTIRRTAEALLMKTGCSVITAEDGFDALSKIVSTQPDIIFIDVMMPRLNGYETCSIIRSNADFDRIPVILLSSKSSFCDKARGTVVGANNYLTKPFSKDELLDAINRHTNPTGRAEAETYVN